MVDEVLVLSNDLVVVAGFREKEEMVLKATVDEDDAIIIGDGATVQNVLSEKGNNDEMSCCFLSAMKKSEGGGVLNVWKWCVYIQRKLIEKWKGKY